MARPAPARIRPMTKSGCHANTGMGELRLPTISGVSKMAHRMPVFGKMPCSSGGVRNAGAENTIRNPFNATQNPMAKKLNPYLRSDGTLMGRCLHFALSAYPSATAPKTTRNAIDEMMRIKYGLE